MEFMYNEAPLIIIILILLPFHDDVIYMDNFMHGTMALKLSHFGSAHDVTLPFS